MDLFKVEGRCSLYNCCCYLLTFANTDKLAADLIVSGVPLHKLMVIDATAGYIYIYLHHTISSRLSEFLRLLISVTRREEW